MVKRHLYFWKITDFLYFPEMSVVLRVVFLLFEVGVKESRLINGEEANHKGTRFLLEALKWCLSLV